MLSKFIMRAAVAAAALTSTAQLAAAEEYRVLMLDFAFFPELSYVEAGDVLTFENTSDATRDIMTEGDAWSLTGIEPGGTVSVTVTEGMPSEFYSFTQGGLGDPVDENGNVRIIGTMQFGGAPQAADN